MPSTLAARRATVQAEAGHRTAAAGPALAGAIFAAGWQATPFIICDRLKIAYGLALLWTFRHIRRPEEFCR
jgi:hypothetical protein